jgi:ATP-binding cassette subfamily C protein CydD
MHAIKTSSNKIASRWLMQRARTARNWVVLSVGLGFCSAVLLIIQAHLLAYIVHCAFIKDMSRETLLPSFGAIMGVVILRAALGWGREVAGFHAGAKVRQEIRTALMQHIFKLGPAYTNRQRTGAIASTLMEQVEGLHDFYAFYLPQLALAVMIPVAILCFVFPITWAAGALLLVTAPLIPLFMILVGMGAESISQRHFQSLARMSAHFLDVLQGLTTLKLFNRSRGEEKTVARVSAEFRKRTMRVLRIAFLSSAVLEFFSSIAIALVAVYLGMTYLGYFDFGTYGKPLTLAGGLFILLLAPDFYLPLRELGIHYHARAEAIGAAEEILKILTVPYPTANNVSFEFDLSDAIQIQCQDVYVSFEEGKRPALRGINFDLNAGEYVALLGASGSGKTTIINLLLGFLHPGQGRVLINERPLCDLKLGSWRRHIAWIGQNPVLFHGTIRENIRLGKPQASDREIKHAARSARVLDFAVHLSDGLDTMVGEQGVGLSRGQAQRVALARAFLKDTPILFLDEPTAALDTENEQLVMNALENLAAGRMVLLLTHRLANIERADRILILEDGKIAEQGTYTELMIAEGIFYQFVKRATGENRYA